MIQTSLLALSAFHVSCGCVGLLSFAGDPPECTHTWMEWSQTIASVAKVEGKQYGWAPVRRSSMHHQAAPLLCHQHALQLQDQRLGRLDKQILSENFAICLLGGPRGASVTERVLTADGLPTCWLRFVCVHSSSRALAERNRSPARGGPLET